MKSNAAKHPHPVIPSDLSAVALAKAEAEGSGLDPEISPLRDAPVEMTPVEDRLAHAKNFANELNESRLGKIKISYQKRWTAHRRARKAVEIQITKPWQHSTGAKTAAGKRRSSLNALRCDPAALALERALRLQRRFLNAFNLLLRLRKNGDSGAKAFAAYCTQLGNDATLALKNAVMAYDDQFSRDLNAKMQRDFVAWQE